MSKTTNYGLEKPSQDDFYDVDVFNGNADILDAKLKEIEDEATEEIAPVYEDAETLETLKSGEKISTAFGKIKLAISTLLSHIANKNNPHGVTKTQVGLGNCDNTADANKSVLASKKINDGSYEYTPTTIHDKFEKPEKWSSTTPSNTTAIDKLQVTEYKLGHIVYVKIDFHLKTAMNYTNSIWIVKNGICPPTDGNKFFRGHVYIASNTTANASTKQTGAVVYAEGSGLTLYNYGEVLPVGDYSCDLYYFTA